MEAGCPKLLRNQGFKVNSVRNLILPKTMQESQEADAWEDLSLRREPRLGDTEKVFQDFVLKETMKR